MNSRQPTVWVANDLGYDYADAKRFGSIAVLLSGKQDTLDVNLMMAEVAEKLNLSDPRDYILMSGLPFATVIAASVFSYMHGRVNFLLYENNKYYERKVILSSLVFPVEVREESNECDERNEIAYENGYEAGKLEWKRQ